MLNHARTFMLLAAMTALFLGIGFLIGGSGGMVVAFLIAAGMNVFAYWNSDKVVLRMYGAREVDAGSAPELFGMVKQLAQRAELPMPRVYVIENEQPNAFATGRNPDNAAVAATTGLLRQMTQEEIAGVMAHELAHIKNRDTLTMTITATIAGAIGMLANFAFFFGATGDNRNNPLGIVGVLLLMIVGPMAAALVQFAISRAREYEADKLGATICGQPLWLASALQRLEQIAGRVDNPQAERNPATAHMFIVNPLHGGKMDNLFSTHPATANRVRKLRELAGTGAPAAPRGPWG